MEHELIWFHTEMAAVLGQALKAHVAAQGAAVGKLSRLQDEHFSDIKAMLAKKPAPLASRTSSDSIRPICNPYSTCNQNALH